MMSRKHGRLLASMLAVLFWMTGGAAAASGGVPAPRGWTEVSQQHAAIYVPPGVPSGEAFYLAVLRGQRLQGDFRAWFDGVMAQSLEAGERVVEDSPVQAHRAEAGYDTLYRTRVIEDAAGRRSYRLYLAAHPPDRVEMLVCQASRLELYARYEPQLFTFIRTWSFALVSRPVLQLIAMAGGGSAASGGSAAAGGSTGAGAGNATTGGGSAGGGNTTTGGGSAGAAGTLETSAPAVVMPRAPTTGPLDGIYVSNRLDLQVNPLLDLLARNEQRFYFFRPDGRVFWGLPKGGQVRTFDFDEAEDTRPGQAGTWRIEGGSIEMQWADTRTTGPLPFQREGERIRIGETYYYRANPGTGTRLEGTFALQGGGLSRAITFQRDGSFSARNFTAFAPRSEPAAFPTTGTGSGTYRITDYTLELTYQGGEQDRFTFFRYPLAEDSVVVVDGVALMRQ